MSFTMRGFQISSWFAMIVELTITDQIGMYCGAAAVLVPAHCRTSLCAANGKDELNVGWADAVCQPLGQYHFGSDGPTEHTFPEMLVCSPS